MGRLQPALWLQVVVALPRRNFSECALFESSIPFSVTRGELDQPITLDSTIPEPHRAFLEDFVRRHALGDLPETDFPVFDPAFIRGQLDVVLDLDVPVYVAGPGEPSYLVNNRGSPG